MIPTSLEFQPKPKLFHERLHMSKSRIVSKLCCAAFETVGSVVV